MSLRSPIEMSLGSMQGNKAYQGACFTCFSPAFVICLHTCHKHAYTHAVLLKGATHQTGASLSPSPDWSICRCTMLSFYSGSSFMVCLGSRPTTKASQGTSNPEESQNHHIMGFFVVTCGIADHRARQRLREVNGVNWNWVSSSFSERCCKMSFFVQPLIFWNSTPPPLSITSVFISRSRTRLVTGCHHGSMILWELDIKEGDDGYVASAHPLSFVIGYTSRIIDLAECLTGADSPAVCALAQTEGESAGNVIVCDLRDGSCKGVIKDVVQFATKMVPLPGLRHMLVAGNDGGAVVLDLAHHSKLCVLQTGGLVISMPQSLATTLPTMEDMDAFDFVTLSKGNYLQYWDAQQMLNNSTKSQVLPKKSVYVDVPQGNACTCDQIPGCGIVLVVCLDSCVRHPVALQ